MGEVSSFDINRLERQINNLQHMTEMVSNQVVTVDSKVSSALGELEELKRDFLQMMEDQRREGEFQRATTELVRVRQELEQKYGRYMFVRDTMLGVLQATDAKLVKVETITRVAEELMLSTPKYWLSPCLIAVAAWIGNDQALAERAIKEAMKRDPEKTSLCMALICRRNEREDTCFEWLSEYFRRQRADDFSDSTFTFVDAYVNGVFGKDRYHRCDDYITTWVNEIQKQSEDFDSQQTSYWANHFSSFTTTTGGRYQALREGVSEFPAIDGYLSRIYASEKIEEEFDVLNNSEVDQDALRREIDERLVVLVNRYAAEEVPLREEEEYLQAVKNYRGDVESARVEIDGIREQRREKKMDLVKKMAEVIAGGESKSLSERKTALHFLHGYINNGYHRFLEEKKDSFPNAININVDGWRGQTSDCQNVTSLYSDYQYFMNQHRQEELSRVNMRAGLPEMITGGVLGLLGIVLLFVVPFLGVLTLVVMAALLVVGISNHKKIPARIDSINGKYDDMITQGQQKIYNAAMQWSEVTKTVDEFSKKEKRDLIA